MSFIDTLKRAFGLTPDADDNDYTPIAEDASGNANRTQAQPNADGESTEERNPIEEPNRDPSVIFEGVVEVINRHMPEFVRGCLDEETERKMLYERLDESVKEYLEKLMTYEADRQREAVSDERAKMRTEIESLRTMSKRVEEANEESTRQRLSAERQKRALTERVHDLEGKIARYEAEKEQFDLENKSLVNKVRALTVQEGDNEALKEELNNLRAELNRMRAKAADGSDSQDEATSDEGVDGQDLREIIENLEQEIANARKENEDLRQANDNLRAKNEVSDAMINDFQSRRAEDLSKIEELTKKLEDVNKQFEVLTEISKDLDKLEEAQRSDAEKISRLTRENSELQGLNERLMAELSASRSNKSEDDAKDYANETVAPAPTPAGNKDAEPRKSRNKKKRGHGLKTNPKITAIDETLNDINWLSSTPPSGSPTIPKTELDDFGYREPAKKPPRPENPAQTSLW